MQDQPTQERERPMDDIERDVLYLLTEPQDNQPIWSVADLGREVEDAGDADVAVHGLHQAGLIHRTCDGFVFATRAGVRAVQMMGHVI